MRIALLTTDNREHHRKYELPAPYFGPAIEALLQGLGEIAELEVHVIACAQQPMSAPEKLAPNIWFHLLHVPKIGWLRTGYQGCVRAVRKKVRELGPDLVHGQGTERECALAAVYSGFPNVLTLLGNMREVARKMKARPGGYLWCAARLESLALQRTGGVLCNSLHTETLVRPLARRTWRVANAIRREFLAPLPLEQEISPSPRLLNIGAVVPYKRQNELLEIANRLHESGHRFELLFIGDANAQTAYAARFRDAIRDATASGFSRHVEARTPPELTDLMDRSSALVHLSFEESFGLVVAEALARNLKVFATAAGGVNDIAIGADGAELFAPGHDANLEAALSHWLHVGCPRPQLAAAEMRTRYAPEVIAEQHLRVYRDFLGEIAQPL